jgi:2-polyprenyl-6-hydroxyphenyl methylase/3-demethylubiquinone-9 3-methyltransferase
MVGTEHEREVSAGERFEFGGNWRRFLALLDEDRIAAAERSLQTMLEAERLDGRRFLDVGSGSGLFSLAAVRLGAQVHSFDYDPQSVACTRYLKESYAPEAAWTIEKGSVLDTEFLATLGRFDIVYAWGVLHHTGAMWEALGNVTPLVRDGGTLYLAIYDDQGSRSERWKLIKRVYNRAPAALRPAIYFPIIIYHEARSFLAEVARGRNPLRPWMSKKAFRGMSRWHDWLDWIGGYPFEVAKPEEIFDFYRSRGFVMRRLKTEGGTLNEFVFVKGPPRIEPQGYREHPAQSAAGTSQGQRLMEAPR